MTRKDTLQVIALAAVTAGLLTWAPYVQLLAWPFRLLTTLVHELAHGLAALITGGRFLRFLIFPDGSGLAYTAGGWRLVVIPAGYLGAAAFGAVLIALGPSRVAARYTLLVLGLAMGVLTLLYAVPSIFSEDALLGLLTFGSGAVFAVVLVWLARRAADSGVVFVVHLLAFMAGLASLSDLLVLIGLSRGADVATDARAMAELTVLPALFWAGLWALVAVLMLAGAVRMTWFAETRRR